MRMPETDTKRLADAARAVFSAMGPVQHQCWYAICGVVRRVFGDAVVRLSTRREPVESGAFVSGDQPVASNRMPHDCILLGVLCVKPNPLSTEKPHPSKTFFGRRKLSGIPPFSPDSARKEFEPVQRYEANGDKIG